MMRCTIRRPKGRRAESVKHNGNRHSVGESRFRRRSSWLLHTFERPVKRMSAAGTRPGDLDFGFRWFVIRNESRWQTSSIRNSCTHMTWASAPTPRATFCVDKSGAKSTPKGLSSISLHGVVADLFHVSGVIGRRHRTTIAPPSALLTQKISRNTSRSSDQ